MSVVEEDGYSEADPDVVDMERELQRELEQLADLPDDQLSLSDTESDDDIISFRKRFEISTTKTNNLDGYGFGDLENGDEPAGTTTTTTDDDDDGGGGGGGGLWDKYLSVLEEKEQGVLEFEKEMEELVTTASVAMNEDKRVQSLDTTHQEEFKSTIQEVKMSDETPNNAKAQEENRKQKELELERKEKALQRERERQKWLAEEAEREHKMAQERLEKRRKREEEMKRKKEQELLEEKKLEEEREKKRQAAEAMELIAEEKRREMEKKRLERIRVEEVYQKKIRLEEERSYMEREDYRGEQLTQYLIFLRESEEKQRREMRMKQEQNAMFVHEHHALQLYRYTQKQRERKRFKLEDRRSRRFHLVCKRKRQTELHQQRLYMEHLDKESAVYSEYLHQQRMYALEEERRRMGLADLRSMQYSERVREERKKREEEERVREAKRVARERKRRRNHAALCIQCWWRSRMAVRVLRSLQTRHRIECAVVRLQCWWRQARARREKEIRLRHWHKQMASAVLIQKMWRGYYIRTKFPYRRHIRENLRKRQRRRERAAIKIQALFRGYRLRKRRDQVLKAVHEADHMEDSDEFDYAGVDDSFFDFEKEEELDNVFGSGLNLALTAAASVFDANGPPLDTPDSPIDGEDAYMVRKSSTSPEMGRHFGDHGGPEGRDPYMEEESMSEDDVMDSKGSRSPAEGDLKHAGDDDEEEKPMKYSEKVKSVAEQWGFKDPHTAAAMLRKSRYWTKNRRKKNKKPEDPMKRFEKIKKKMVRSTSLESTLNGPKGSPTKPVRVARRSASKGRRGNRKMNPYLVPHHTIGEEDSSDRSPPRTAWVGAAPVDRRKGKAVVGGDPKRPPRKRAHIRASRHSLSDMSQHDSPTYASSPMSSHLSVTNLSDVSSMADLHSNSIPPSPLSRPPTSPATSHHHRY